jgi:hypothetical protein
MPTETATAIAYVGAFVGLIGGGVALFNARKAVAWKKAELASSYMKELTTNQELVFACRAMDWNGGVLVVPETLQALLQDGAKTIKHDRDVMHAAMTPGLTLSQMEKDPRIQIYRTAFDSLLSWLSLVDHALNRKLFGAVDVRDLGYWVNKIDSAQWLSQFILHFGYSVALQSLKERFRDVYKPPAPKVPYEVVESSEKP